MPLPSESEKGILSFAPYSIRIYQDLLRHLAAEEKYSVCHLENIFEKKRKDKINILLRHDIDTAQCIKNMGLLLEEDLKHQIIPSVYLRVDGETYDLRCWKNAIDEYHQRGIPFGLHSVCYVHDRYAESFMEETKKFIDETGIIPRSFTLHGLGEHCRANRMNFISRAKEIAEENGYTMTDCSSRFISYTYVLDDSSCEKSTGRRYITREFEAVPDLLKGKLYLILTHPCYWNN